MLMADVVLECGAGEVFPAFVRNVFVKRAQFRVSLLLKLGTKSCEETSLWGKFGGCKEIPKRMIAQFTRIIDKLVRSTLDRRLEKLNRQTCGVDTRPTS